MSDYWREPKDAKTNQPGGAWWYASKGGIEIHYGNGPISSIEIKISRAQLLEYIERSAPTVKARAPKGKP